MLRVSRVLCVIASGSLAWGAPPAEPPLQRAEFTQLLMGVQARVVVYAPSRETAESGAKAAFDRIAELEQVMSDYRPDSELSRLNAAAGGPAVPLSADLWSILKSGKAIAEHTNGTFDPTMGPLVQLWRESRKSGSLPSTQEVHDRRQRVGVSMLVLDERKHSATLAAPRMALDLGGIGKGAAVHEAVQALKQRGLPRALVSLAGDIATGDAPPGEHGWTIAVETGYEGGRATIQVSNACCSTSGDAEQFVVIGGVRYSHIIDPATGLGSTRPAAACVVANDGGTADALATALAVMGVDKGRSVLSSFPGASAMIVESRAASTVQKFVSEGFPVVSSTYDPENEPPAGFFALFNGKDLSGWQGLAESPPALAAMTAHQRSAAQAKADQGMRAHWSVDNGVLKFDGKGESLQTARMFRDCELYVDWSIDKAGDSGIYLRGSPQVQIWDNPIGSGGLYNNQRNLSRPLAVVDKPLGEWNRFHIIMRGDRVTVYLNGTLVVDDTHMESYWEPGKPLYELGAIELQAHGNPLRFRNIFIREVTDPPAPTDQDRRMTWWRDARFGMFIHWGLYAIPAGEWNGKAYDGAAEWLMNSAKIPPAEYETLAPKFNPVKFDPNAWADLARDAGMKYVVITTKHHDGFCLFDSACTTYDVMDATPFKRDIMKELSTAVRDKGLHMCWYHSILDWHHPDANKDHWAQYASTLRKQVEEVLTKYGPIGVMWFDGEWENEWTTEQGKALYDLCRKLQTDVIVNNRVGKGRQGMQGLTAEGDHPGDFGTPEQEVPRRGLPGVDWETCMTMNDTWGFHRKDANWKSAKKLIQMLAETASKGGNLLLNVGPTELGEIPAASVERLKAMGAWMRVNSSSIYESQAGPFARLPWGRCTMKESPSGSILYLHVFDWPATGELQVPGLMNEVKRAYLLANPAKPLSCSAFSQGLAISLPATAPDANDSVVVLELIGHAAIVDSPLSQQPDGGLVLSAEDAEITGEHARYESDDAKRCIGYWTSDKDAVSWSFAIRRPGKFQVEAEFACDGPSAGSEAKVEVAGTSLPWAVTGSGGWDKFETRDLGTVDLVKGTQTLRVAPAKLAKDALVNLRAIRLVPVPRME